MGVCVLVILSTGPIGANLGVNLVPRDDQSEFQVSFITPEGYTLEKTDQVVTGTRDQRYAADGALDGAIKRFQTMIAAGQIPCSTSDPNFFTYAVHTKTANVECTGLPGAGDTPNPPYP